LAERQRQGVTDGLGRVLGSMLRERCAEGGAQSRSAIRIARTQLKSAARRRVSVRQEHRDAKFSDEERAESHEAFICVQRGMNGKSPTRHLENAWSRRAVAVMARSERATLRAGVAAFRELETWCGSRGLDAGSVDGADLDEFVATRIFKSRAGMSILSSSLAKQCK
jgi:hypothetical protein